MNYKLFFFVGKIEMLSLTILPIYTHILSAPTMEQKTYRSFVHGNETFEQAWWYLDLSGNLYQRRAELKKDGFRWDPQRRVWWKSVPSHTVPIHIQQKQKNDYISDLHSQGLTYPLLHAKCTETGCNNKQKKGILLCSDCDYLEKIKGGLPCNGWMSVTCKYGTQLTIVGAMSCEHCHKDALEWGKTQPFKNDNS